MRRAKGTSRYFKTRDGRIHDSSGMQAYESDGPGGAPVFDGYGAPDGTYFPAEGIAAESDFVEELCNSFSLESALPPHASIRVQPALFASYSYARLQAKKEPVIGYIIVPMNDHFALVPIAKSNMKGEFELL